MAAQTWQTLVEGRGQTLDRLQIKRRLDRSQGELQDLGVEQVDRWGLLVGMGSLWEDVWESWDQESGFRWRQVSEVS